MNNKYKEKEKKYIDGKNQYNRKDKYNLIQKY